ncbi:MAG: hypothetical protein LRS49_06045 [Desulfurococcales archaeon]|nr:hypothetical protein [Desulfurococcales archaeon]
MPWQLEGAAAGGGVGSIVGAVIIVLLLLLGVAAFLRQESLSRRQASVERLTLTRQSLEAQARIYLRVGVVGGASGYNGTIGVYNGLTLPLKLRAIVLVTVDGDVGLLTASQRPSWLAGASATLYRVVGGALEYVEGYPDLVRALASGLVLPPGHLLEVSLQASRELDLLRVRLGFDAPLAAGGRLPGLGRGAPGRQARGRVP